MKIRYVPDDDIVTVLYNDSSYAVAEARELKTAGFRQRHADKGCLGEWTLVARSQRDFRQLIRNIPASMVSQKNGRPERGFPPPP